MGVDGKFGGVTHKDLLDFADRHGVQYAKKSLKDVKAALANWPDYAKRANLSSVVAEEIALKMKEITR